MDMIQQQEHIGIKQTTDLVYLQTIEAAAVLQTYLQKPRGNVETPFLNFYSSFSSLFMLTGNRKAISKKEGYEKQLEELRRWFEASKIDNNRAKSGLKYFQTWQELLEHVGIISP